MHMLKKHFWKIFVVVCVILVAGSIVYSKQVAEKANNGVTIENHMEGNLDSSVVLVEYSDFQCPACGQFYPYLKEVMDQYGDQIRFEYRHFPLVNIHPYALPAARAAEAAAQQGKFWEMHDKLFENQTVWSKSSNPSAYFNKYAEELGLDMSLFKSQIDSSVINDAIKASMDDAISRGFNGTPTFMLNDKVMEFTTFDEFKSQIATAVEEAGNTN